MNHAETQRRSLDIHKQTIDHLDDMLCVERAAVDCYALALMQLGTGGDPDLVEARDSHASRIDSLGERLIAIGGVASDGNALGAGFASLMHRLPQILGRARTFYALEEGESHCLCQYRERLHRLDRGTRLLIEHVTLPEQTRVHGLMLALLRRSAPMPVVIGA